MKPCWLYPLLILASAFALADPSTTNPSSLLGQINQHNLRNIYNGEPFQLSAEKDWTLITVFEDQCNWCLKQMKSFNSIVARHPNVQVLGAGKGDDRFKLMRWSAKANPSFKVIQLNQHLLELLGNPPATPFTFIVDSQGQLVASVRGYYDQFKWGLWLKL